ncbi:AAA family ATPase [Tsukamurella sp. 1534]|uniref:AAA family ATPase n=1 Tax=Tsukamurella sp. 1534 TaxID=1151061 RepID=UPI0002E89DD0|nr:AAA family ATPase [Tsukamurella sp. 1534]
MSADVIILAGPAGTGKSTTARALAATYPKSVHLHTDDFWHNIVSGAIAPYLPESDPQNQTVLRVIEGAARTYASGGYLTVVDGFIGPWMLHHFLGPGGIAAGTRLHYVVLRTGLEETLRRAQGRSGPDDLVDEGPIVALWKQFSDLGGLEKHVIDTTGHAAEDSLHAVQRAIAGGDFLLAAP